jgi:hypothetical protein
MRDEDREKIFHPSAFILHPLISRRPVDSDVGASAEAFPASEAVVKTNSPK